MKAKEIIGRNIQRHREMAELKQETLAKILDITPSALSQIETGKTDISVTRIEEIALALNKSFFDLVTTPNHIGGIQNSVPIESNNELTSSIKDLLIKINNLLEKTELRS